MTHLFQYIYLQLMLKWVMGHLVLFNSDVSVVVIHPQETPKSLFWLTSSFARWSEISYLRRHPWTPQEWWVNSCSTKWDSICRGQEPWVKVAKLLCKWKISSWSEADQGQISSCRVQMSPRIPKMLGRENWAYMLEGQWVPSAHWAVCFQEYYQKWLCYNLPSGANSWSLWQSLPAEIYI